MKSYKHLRIDISVYLKQHYVRERLKKGKSVI